MDFVKAATVNEFEEISHKVIKLKYWCVDHEQAQLGLS